MRPLHAAALFLSAYTTSGPEPLKSVRPARSDEAAPTSVVAVTFDRPVAGSLDRTVDPKAILTITPAVQGRLEWRDPVTIRLTPAAPLASNIEYTVTVANTFAAMDGSRLEAPYRFTFRVRGPRLLAGSPVSGNRHPKFVTPATRVAHPRGAPARGLRWRAGGSSDSGCGGHERLRAVGLSDVRPVAVAECQLSHAPRRPLPDWTDQAGVHYARTWRERPAARGHQARAVVRGQRYVGRVRDMDSRSGPQTAHRIHGGSGQHPYRHLRPTLHRQRR